jgi:hypothetical protein
MSDIYVLSLPITLNDVDNCFNDFFNEQVKGNYPLLKQKNNIYSSDYVVKHATHQVKTETFTERNPFCMKNSVIKIDNIKSIPQTLEASSTELLLPSKTDLHCWWCCHQFNNPIIYCPVSYHLKKDIFKVKGVFCSYSCSYAYSLKDASIKDKSLIKFMYKTITSKRFDGIKPAPPKEVLKIFGGSKTIEEFRNCGENPNIDMSINIYPLVYIPCQIETKEIVSLVNESLDNVKRVKSAKIDIKREEKQLKKKEKKKPEQKEDGSLEALLGLKIS